MNIPQILATPHIGSDETLKGDTFGGIVVCACYLTSTEDFLALGVKDSKQLTTEQIKRIAKQLLEAYPNCFSITSLLPKEYNHRLAQGSQTLLLNQLHSELALQLFERFGKQLHVVDKFPGCQVGDIALSQAESASVAVAAASIVARYHGLLQIELLSKQAGFSLPLGSTHVSEALTTLLAKDLDFEQFVKLHFKNVRVILERKQAQHDF